MDLNNPKEVYQYYAKGIPTCHRMLEPRQYRAPAGYPPTELGFIADVAETVNSLLCLARTEQSLQEEGTVANIHEVTRSSNHLASQAMRIELGCPTFFLRAESPLLNAEVDLNLPTKSLFVKRPALRVWLPPGARFYVGRTVYALTIALIPKDATVDQPPGLLEEMARSSRDGIPVGNAVGPQFPLPQLFVQLLLEPGVGTAITAMASGDTLQQVMDDFWRHTSIDFLSDLTDPANDPITLKIAMGLLLAAAEMPAPSGTGLVDPVLIG